MPTEPQYEAMERLQRSIDFSRQLPENVFRGRWCEMLFFDSDLIFHRSFANLTRELLLIEGANSICMCCRHQATADLAETQSFFFLDERTTPELYITFLAKEWILLMGRFALISDIGRWCIYTERTQEFAIMAIADSAIRDSAGFIIDKLGALRIESALENPPSFGLTPQGLTQEGRKRLLEAYGAVHT